jgi:hypothetical protein
MIKAAASRKVLNKMLGVMAKNPAKYNMTAEDIKEHRMSIASGEPPPGVAHTTNRQVSRELNVEEPAIRRAIRGVIKRHKNTKGPLDIVKAYDIADAPEHPKQISRAMPHMAVDVFDPSSVESALETYGASNFDEAIENYVSEYKPMPGKKPHLDMTPDYERVTKPSYLKPRREGTLFRKGWGRSELVDRANEIKEKLRWRYTRMKPSQKGALKEDLGEMERALKGKKMPKPKGLEVHIPYLDDQGVPINRAVPEADHTLAFRGSHYRPAHGHMTTVPHYSSEQDYSTWVSPHPEIANLYAVHGGLGFRPSTAPFYLNTSNPKLIQEFSKSKYKPKGYT